VTHALVTQTQGFLAGTGYSVMSWRRNPRYVPASWHFPDHLANNQVLDAETLRIAASTNRDDAVFDVLVADYRLQRTVGVL
jgi:hypothetical protein